MLHVAGGDVQVVDQPLGEFRLWGMAPLQKDNKGMGGKQTAEQMLAEAFMEFLRHLLPECSPVPCHAWESFTGRPAALGGSLISLCG